MSGVKVVASALVAHNYNLVYEIDPATLSKTKQSLRINIPPRTIKERGSDNFAVLTATDMYKSTITSDIKHQLTGKTGIFNSRKPGKKGNIHGQRIRFIIGDSGFKEGVDLFDVKYVHILEPQLSPSDFKQAVGRSTRTCGQAGLFFFPDKGHTLHVYEYNLELSDAFGGKKWDDLVLEYSQIDPSINKITNQVENLMLQSAVDRDLNIAVNFYGRDPETDQELQLFNNQYKEIKELF